MGTEKKSLTKPWNGFLKHNFYSSSTNFNKNTPKNAHSIIISPLAVAPASPLPLPLSFHFLVAVVAFFCFSCSFSAS